MTAKHLLMTAPAAGGGFTPTSLSGLVAWYDASDAATISDTGGLVDQWNDKSGNTRHVTASGTQRPTTGSRTINSLNVVDFDGGDVMTVASVTNASPFTIMMVAAFDAGNAVALSLSEGTIYSAYQWIGGKWRAFNSPSVIEESVASANTSPHVTAFVSNGASSRLDVDGATVASGTVGTTSGNRINLGSATSSGSTYLNGAIAEVVIYDSALSTGDQSSVETYLADKWGITL